jgi:rubredoxin
MNTAGADPADARAPGCMECSICWHVYDPREGDGFAQIPAGTAFADLPEHWCCPNCDAPRHKFLAVQP